MVGDRDRSEARSLRRLEQRARRRRAVRRVIGVHVKVHVDGAPARDPRRRTSGSPRRLMPEGGETAIRLLHLVGDVGPAPARAPPVTREPGAQPGIGHQPLELAGEGDHVAGPEQEPAVAVAGELLVDGDVRTDGDRPRRQGLADQPRGRVGAAGRGARDVGARDQLLRRRVAGAYHLNAVAEANGDPQLPAVRHHHRGLPRRVGGKAPQRAKERPHAARAPPPRSTRSERRHRRFRRLATTPRPAPPRAPAAPTGPGRSAPSAPRSHSS